MPKFEIRSTFAALTFLGLSATAAQAGDWTNSSMYNGYGTTSMNTASNYSMRDANGNLTMVNGQITPSTYSNATGSQYATAGVGTAGASGAANGQAPAVRHTPHVARRR